MTLTEFGAIAKTRIPTSEEFVNLVESQGWRIEVRSDGKATLRASDAKDALARSLARMLSREPYRTGVLALAMARWKQPKEESPIPKVTLPAEPSREWLWRYGQRYRERDDANGWRDDWLCGHPDRHPAGAFWWRWIGETNWREIEGRNAERIPLPEGETV